MTNRIITTLFAFFILATNVISQEKKADCQDVVYLKGRSVFRGTITEYKTDGYLVMTTWSGGQIQVPAINVNRIVQKCKEDKPVGASSPGQRIPLRKLAGIMLPECPFYSGVAESVLAYSIVLA